MAMEKTGVTEQDIADALSGKKDASPRPPHETSPIGEDFLSKMAGHAKEQIVLKTGRTTGKSATDCIVK